jgi:hypothetical protein
MLIVQKKHSITSLNYSEDFITELKKEKEALKAEGGVKTHYQEVMRKQQTEMDKEHIRYLEKVQEVGELKKEKKKMGMEHCVVADVLWNWTREGDDCSEDMKKELIETGGMGEWWVDEDE